MVKKQNLLQAFLLNLAMGAIIVALGFLLGDGVLYHGADYNFQQIPFHTLARENLLQGNYYWLDNFELGTSMVGALSFYLLGSPFFWLSLLLPGADYVIMVPCLLVLKFAVAGTGAYCYAKQYVSQHRWALLASVLYAFSGYQLANMNYNHFHDVTALFPFLLLALDAAVKRDKKLAFAVMVALCALTNYFFFAAIVVFLVLYFAAQVLWGEYRITPRLFGRLALESLLGVGLAMVLLLPNVFFVLGNPRVSDSIFSRSLLNVLFLKPYQYADLLRALLLPAESIFKRAFILEMNPTAAELYLPVVGAVPTFAFMLREKKHWMTRLLAVCFVFMLTPVLNNSFTLFNGEYYTRWFFMPLLVMAVMSAKFFEDGISIKKGLWVWGGVAALFAVARLLWKYYFQVEFFPNKLVAFLLMGIALCGLAVTVLVCLLRHRKIAYLLLMAAVVCQTAICGALTIYYSQKYWDENQQSAEKFFYQVPELQYPDGDEYYRTDTKNVFINTGLVAAKPSANVFASNISGSVFEFYQANGMARSVNSFLERRYCGFYSMLGVKYMIMPQGTGPDTPGFTDAPVWSDLGYDFYQNTNYIGMGYACPSAISQEEYGKMDQEQRHLIAAEALVLSQEDLVQYGHLFSVKTAADYADVSYDSFVQAVQQRLPSAAQSFGYEKGCYSFTAPMEADGIYFVAVPWDGGFTATVNGQSAPVLKVNNGFIGIPMSAGNNSVQLTFRPQGLVAGGVVSGLSLVGLAGYAAAVVVQKKRKNEVYA